MPFSRYLQSNEREHAHDDDDSAFSTNVHFQLPNLIFNAPSVPPGGGAEALPAGLYPPPASLSWFAPPDAYNHPFNPHHAYQSASNPLPFPPPYLSLPSDPHSSSLVPSPPVYSSSGFDLLSLLARVHSRPYPKIYLGAVDLSCSFVVTDTRRFDAPIVYASPSFLKLTGYDEHEVIGRNCRFLQAPGGPVLRAHERPHTSSEAVAHMRKNIVADKECQVSLINYRKDGSPFVNMVSVIPIPGGIHNTSDEADDIVYHIGFQVDLSDPSKSIFTKLRDGTYLPKYSDKLLHPSPLASRDWRTSSMTMRGMSSDLRSLLADSAFTASFQLSTSTHASTAIALSNSPSEPISLDPYDGNKPLHMFLLDRSPDFLHVVSLKGAFLYVAPAVRHVLGYDPDELVGRSLTDFCHPADCVPIMRELKDASSAAPGPLLLTTTNSPPSSSPPTLNLDTPSAQPSSTAAPRPVDLLFRMQAKGRGYVWIECRGRLHVEPGKGRKAIILSGRLRYMPYLEWGPISRAGGLVPPGLRSLPSSPLTAGNDKDEDPDDVGSVREFWGLLSTNATFLYVGAAVRDALGWGACEVIGKPLADFVSGNPTQEVHLAIEVEMNKILAVAGGSENSGLICSMRTKDGSSIPVHVVLYRSRSPPPPVVQGSSGVAEASRNAGDPAVQSPVVCQVKLCDGASAPPKSQILHPHGESVFNGTDLDRGSSWQYELRQLEFGNRRLAEEVAALEAGISKKIRRKQTGGGVGPGGVGGGRTTMTPLSVVTPRMNNSFVGPTGHSLSVGSSLLPPQQQSSPLNVRFVSDGHGISRPEPSQSSRSHVSSPPSQMPTTATMHQRSAGQPQHPAMPPAPIPHVFNERGGSGVFASARVRQSTESSLQGWSLYQYEHAQAEPGAGQGNQDRSVSYSALPMKRTWDSSLRDPGGGGA